MDRMEMWRVSWATFQWTLRALGDMEGVGIWRDEDSSWSEAGIVESRSDELLRHFLRTIPALKSRSDNSLWRQLAASTDSAPAKKST